MPKPQRKLRAEAHLYLEPKLHDTLVRLCSERQMSKNELITRLIEVALKPPADHTDVVLRRMERLEKTVAALTKSLQALGDGLTKSLQAQTEQTQRTHDATRQELAQVAAQQRTLTQGVHAARVEQGERQERLVQTLRALAEERPGLAAKAFAFVTGGR